MSARRDALNALIEICEKGAYTNLCLKDRLQDLPQNEKQWISALIYTTLEHLELIDYYIQNYAKGKMQPIIRGILRLGVCQILFMRTPASAACNESVKLTKEIGKTALSAYVNAVLRSIGRAAQDTTLPPLPEDITERFHIQYGYPQFLIQEYIREYGSEFTQKMLECRQQGMTIRAQWPFDSAELEKTLSKSGTPFRRGLLNHDAFHLEKGMEMLNGALFKEGKITVQSESAMLVCRVLDAEKGRILDACSAPGGKSAYLASCSHDKAEILAWEIHPHRAELIKNTMERLHVKNVKTECRDATVFDPAFESMMDAVLLDVPCSGLGLPDKPDVRYRKTDEAIRSLCELQRSILECCCRYVKPGGVMVYSTCTISRRENEEQICSFQSRHPEFSAAVLSPYLPASMQSRTQNGKLQLFPHLDGTEGFFIAKLEKRK